MDAYGDSFLERKSTHRRARNGMHLRSRRHLRKRAASGVGLLQRARASELPQLSSLGTSTVPRSDAVASRGADTATLAQGAEDYAQREKSDVTQVQKSFDIALQ